MTEAREVAVTLLPWYRAILGSTKASSTEEKAMRYVRERFRNETQTVMDNVAWELHQLAKAGPTTPCPTLCTCRPTRGLACRIHWGTRPYDPLNERAKEPTKEGTKD